MQCLRKHDHERNRSDSRDGETKERESDTQRGDQKANVQQPEAQETTRKEQRLEVLHLEEEERARLMRAHFNDGIDHYYDPEGDGKKAAREFAQGAKLGCYKCQFILGKLYFDVHQNVYDKPLAEKHLNLAIKTGKLSDQELKVAKMMLRYAKGFNNEDWQNDYRK